MPDMGTLLTKYKLSATFFFELQARMVTEQTDYGLQCL